MTVRTPTQLMEKADLAMYHAKDTGRDRYHFFKSTMRERAIREALAKRTTSRRNRTAEVGVALPAEARSGDRRNRRRRSVDPVAPPAFLRDLVSSRANSSAIAEECGLIVPFGRWVLRKACRQARAWQLAGLPSLCISTNVLLGGIAYPGLRIERSGSSNGNGLGAAFSGTRAERDRPLR